MLADPLINLLSGLDPLDFRLLVESVDFAVFMSAVVVVGTGRGPELATFITHAETDFSSLRIDGGGCDAKDERVESELVVAWEAGDDEFGQCELASTLMIIMHRCIGFRVLLRLLHSIVFGILLLSQVGRIHVRHGIQRSPEIHRDHSRQGQVAVRALFGDEVNLQCFQRRVLLADPEMIVQIQEDLMYQSHFDADVDA